MCKIKDHKCAVLLQIKIQHNDAMTLIYEAYNGGSLSFYKAHSDPKTLQCKLPQNGQAI